MKKTTKIFIRFYYPGFLFAETCTYKVSSEKAALKKALADKYWFRYELLRREDIVDGKETYAGRAEVYKTVVFAKEICTLEDIKRMKKDGANVETVLANMEMNGYEKVVKIRCGRWEVWEEGVEYVSE